MVVRVSQSTASTRCCPDQYKLLSEFLSYLIIIMAKSRSRNRSKTRSRSRYRKKKCILALDFDETLTIRDSGDEYIVRLYTEFIRSPTDVNRATLTRALFGSNTRLNNILIPLLSIEGVEYVVVSANTKDYGIRSKHNRCRLVFHNLHV